MLLVASLVGCQKPAEAPKEDPARIVEVARVATQDAVRTSTVVGTLEGLRQVQVFAVMPERVVSLRVKEGDVVEKGKILAVLAADVQNEAVRQAEAALGAIEAARDALFADVERTRKLVAAQAAPKSQLESLENQLKAQEAQVRQMETGLSAAAVQRRRAVVVAPISGRATNIAVREGDMATPQVPILSIVEGSRVKAVFRVPERTFIEIEAGMPVSVGLLGDHTVQVDSRVSVRGLVVDARSRTGLVEVELDNAEGRLIPGAAVRARFELERRPSVVLVPASAVLLTPTSDIDRKAIAFVAKGEKAERRDVILGVQQGGLLEVIRGLEVGEWLVVKGQHLLRDGEAIAPTEESDGAAAATPGAERLGSTAPAAPTPSVEGGGR